MTALDIVNEYVRINDLKLSEEKKRNYESKKPILEERYKIHREKGVNPPPAMTFGDTETPRFKTDKKLLDEVW